MKNILKLGVNELRIVFTITLFSVYSSFTHSSMFDDIINGDFKLISEKRELRSWNDENITRVQFSGMTLGCFNPAAGMEIIQQLQARVSDDDRNITIKGKVKNNSDRKIESALLTIKIMNKETGSIVVENLLTVPLEVFPTIEKAFSDQNKAESYSTRASEGTLALIDACLQLGENFSWNYEVIALLPEGFRRKAFYDEFWNP